MNKEEKLNEEYKKRTLFKDFEIKDLVEVINGSPTLLDKVPFLLYTKEEEKIIRDLLEEVAYKTYEIEMKNKEILLSKLKEGKHSKKKNINVINIKAHSKEDALSQLKEVLPKDIYNRIKKEMI